MQGRSPEGDRVVLVAYVEEARRARTCLPAGTAQQMDFFSSLIELDNPSLHPTVQHEERWITTEDSLRLYSHSWLPERIQDHLCVIHGLSEHSGRYGNLANHFLPRHYAIHLLDQRGFGRSQGQRGHVDSYLRYLDDLQTFLQDVRQRHPTGRLFLVGHSLGGVIALAYGIKHPTGLHGLILSAPGLKTRGIGTLLHGIVTILNRFIPRFPLRHPFMPQHLSRDPSVGEAYVKDPLVHPYLTPRFLIEFLKMLSFVHSHAGDLHLPTLILCPTDDRIVNPQGSIDFFNAIINSQKKLITYAGYYHEIFSEIGKERVFTDMEAWLEKVT